MNGKPKEPFIVKCCVCSKLRIELEGVKVWIHAVAPGHSTVSHTYCPECAKVAKAEAEEYASQCSG
jgi:hypothetical protein